MESLAGGGWDCEGDGITDQSQISEIFPGPRAAIVHALVPENERQHRKPKFCNIGQSVDNSGNQGTYHER
jgi:hypothetical protein